MNDSTKYNDEQLRRQLENYAEMPSDKVWSGVTAALEQKKKKRRLLFWILLLGGIASGSTVWFFAGSTYSGAVLTAQQNQEPKPAQPAAPQSKPATAAGKNPQTNTANTALAAEKSNIHSYSNSVTTAGTSAPVSGKGTKHTQNNAGRAPENIAQTPAGNTGKKDGSQHTNTGLPQLSDNGNTSAAAHTPGRSSATGKGIPESSSRQASVSAGTVADTPHPLSLTPRGKLSLSNGIPQPALLKNRFRDSTTLYKTIPAVSVKIAPFISLEASAGSVWYKRNQVPANDISSGNAQTRKSGIYAAALLRGGFSFRGYAFFSLGVGYESFRFSNPYALTYTSVPGAGSGNLNQDLNTPSFEAYGDVNIPLPISSYNGSQTINGRLRMNTHNIFIPLDMGFSFPVLHNLHLGISGGPALHFLLKQEVYFLSEDGSKKPVSISEPSRVNVSLGIEPSLSYHIHGGLSIFASGAFRYHMLSAVKDPSIRSMPYRASGQLGVRLYLNGVRP